MASCTFNSRVSAPVRTYSLGVSPSFTANVARVNGAAVAWLANLTRNVP